MPDLGEPSSYLSLGKGADVYTSDGEKVGKVEHVLAVPEDDIFDGIVLDTSVLPGGHRFVDADQVEEIFERGVLLKIDRAAAEKLPKPSPSPGALEVGPDELSEPEESALRQKLGRAWDLISGKR
jgi:sporulation protein YlmC with PRC-barrel domain